MHNLLSAASFVLMLLAPCFIATHVISKEA